MRMRMRGPGQGIFAGLVTAAGFAAVGAPLWAAAAAGAITGWLAR